MKILSFLTTLFAVSVATIANAGTISPTGTTISGPGLGAASVPVIFTLSPGNDNQTGGGAMDNNVTVPFKRFATNGYIDIVFSVRDDAGVTEYQVIESVDNDTGTDWSGYIMELGFGSGTSFVASTAGDGLDFDAPDYDTPPTSTGFAVVDTSDEDVLVYSSGLQTTGGEAYSLRIDVPNGIQTFTLRQYPVPVVPEPGSIALLAMGAFGLLAYRRRK